MGLHGKEPSPKPGSDASTKAPVNITTPPHDPAELERDVLLVVWHRGFITADQVREDLDI
jgi:hypothetical protein